MNKILYVSYCAPYDKVRHAGGKTHNYYLKILNKFFDVTLITYVNKHEIDKLDLDEYKIKHKYIFRYRNIIERIFIKLINLKSKFGIFGRYGGFVSDYEVFQMNKKIKELVKSNYVPSLILLEWTQILFMLPIIKKYYPNVPVYTIEEDVAFLGWERRYQRETNPLFKKYFYEKFVNVKKIELNNLNLVDRVFTNNEKDKKLLLDNGIDVGKIDILMPYYDDYSECRYNNKSKNIMFFGAMERPENWKSAIWFIDNVMPLLGSDFTYTVVGNKPPRELLNRKSSRVNVTGFVESVKPYFEDALCFVSPLILGAGVKVKIIEAFTSGIPVVCNNVSIEGIAAVDGLDYIHCETPAEYAKAITQLAEDEAFAKQIGQSGRAFVLENYSYKRYGQKLAETIEKRIS